MARTIINDQYLTDIAVAIRNKNKSETLYKPKEMAAAIDAIEGGVAEPVIEALEITANGTYEAPEGIDGYSPITVAVPSEEPVLEELEITANGTYTPGEGVDGFSSVVANVPLEVNLPEGALTITGDCSYRFAYTGWNWFLDTFKNQIETKDITCLANFLYQNNRIKEFPAVINLHSSCYDFRNAFSGNTELTKVPTINGEITSTSAPNFSSFFYSMRCVANIPDDYFWTFGGDAFWERAKNNASTNVSSMFYNCYSLRKLPDISMLRSAATLPSRALYNNFAYNTYALDEALNVPVYGTFTSNALNSVAYYAHRLKNFTFETNADGTPITANWKTQTMNISTGIGYVAYSSYITSYSQYTGITEDKRVIDDATYQALKDDPDWWTMKVEYSRYNHDSAVATINSLPDTSAYLAEKGGINIIKFDGDSGSLTDGGAINTLTEEEIAVATAKGWTVSLV